MNARPITPPPQLQKMSSENQFRHSFSLPSQLTKASIYSFPIKEIDIQVGPDAGVDRSLDEGTLAFPVSVSSLYVNFQAYMMVDTLEYFGTRYNVGQIVAVKGKDGCIYYVEVRQLYLNEYNQKFFSFTWLLPMSSSDCSSDTDDLLTCSQESTEAAAGRVFRRTSLHKVIESLDCIIGPI